MKHASSSHPIELSWRLFERGAAVRFEGNVIASSSLEPYDGVQVRRWRGDRGIVKVFSGTGTRQVVSKVGRL